MIAIFCRRTEGICYSSWCYRGCRRRLGHIASCIIGDSGLSRTGWSGKIAGFVRSWIADLRRRPGGGRWPQLPKNIRLQPMTFMIPLTWLRFGVQSASFLFKLAEYLIELSLRSVSVKSLVKLTIVQEFLSRLGPLFQSSDPLRH